MPVRGFDMGMTHFIRLFLVTLFIMAPAAQAADNTLASTSAKQAYMMDTETGQVLFAKNAQEQMPTSSMSKVMTMYLVFEALKDGTISLDTKMPVSEKAWRMGGSKMFVEVGDEVPVKDLIQGVIVQSGNDATVVLAEGIAGSEDEFAYLMNIKAKELGMDNSNFVNASGWPDPNHYSTAEDLAILAEKISQEFPDYYDYYSQKEYTYNNIRQTNRNPLLYRNMGVDGIKTGHTEDGGYGLMASGERAGRRVIMVVNGLESKKARAQESARLMEWGMRSFENIDLFKAGEVIDQASVIMGKSETVSLVIEEDVTITLPKMAKSELDVNVIYVGPIEAPVQEGQQIATLEIVIPRLETKTYPLVAGESVERLGLFAQTIEKAKLFISGKAGTNE